MHPRILMTAAALATLAQVAQPVHASEPYRCLVFEDDSFACGAILTVDPADSTLMGDAIAAVPAPYGTWVIDRSKPWVSGCIPGGVCDEDMTPLRKHAARTNAR